jgi:hypothetical protein
MSDAPHPLAVELAEALAGTSDARRVLVVGVGSGRNVQPLLQAGLWVDILEPDPERARAATIRFASERRVRVVRGRLGGPIPLGFGFDGALSTHALLHGTPRDVAAAALAVALRLRADGRFFATLGCTGDPRFGVGTRIDRSTFAPEDGREAGIAHAYFREDEIARTLAPFEIERVERVEAGTVVGSWAHDEGERIVHWFVRARR